MHTSDHILFRDPIHDVITFDTANPAENLLLKLINTDTFQRLRRVRQLGMANFVYHGAEHSRFQHSIGVAHIARRIAHTLDLSTESTVEVLCAALLHDIGHGPFSHAIEKVTNLDHEEFTRALISDPDSDIYAVLATFDATLPQRISRYFEKRSLFPVEKQILRDIVSSQLDADRMDYLQRDAHMTGVKVGRFDFERIYAMLTLANIDGVTRLAVNLRAREAVEGYLIARAHMYKQVYLHETVRTAEKMLQAVLYRARIYIADNADAKRTLNPIFTRLLEGDSLPAMQYATLDDTDVWVAFKQWIHAPDPILASLADALLNRHLYNTYNIDVSDNLSAGRLTQRARDIAVDLNLDPDVTVLLDYAEDTPYRPYSPSTVSNPNHICIVDDNGDHVPIEEISEMVRLLGRETYKITRLCVHPSISPRLEKTISVIGGVQKW